ncbi:MAG: hypothetical protein IJ087_07285 [Eggerthellaceae bacterium]|nr:hypothetical protein [Eggerthellaceae bacterium]
MTRDDAALSEAAAEFVEKVRKLDGITIVGPRIRWPTRRPCRPMLQG